MGKEPVYIKLYQSSGGTMHPIPLQRDSRIPMKCQIYQAFREQILNGELLAGSILPSTRGLSEQMGISRNTVCEAYDMLITEGFVLSSQGAPTRVADGLHIGRVISDAGQPHIKEKVHYAADFQTGRPDMRLFPRYVWQQMMHKALTELPPEAYEYGDPQGMESLRGEISEWLFRSRGLTAEADDIFITGGATGALHLISCLLGRGDGKVVIEDPCNRGVMDTFLQAGCLIEPVPADEKGMDVSRLPKKDVSAVYLTPSHQFPLGGILPAGRRAVAIRYAAAKDVYLIEDDYDSEFRYAGEPVSPLYAMAPQRVIYVGTFSKVLFPALRIGYVILPRKLQEAWRILRMHTDVQNAPFEQAALAEFLQTRKFDRHIRTMRKLYGARRKVLLECLKESFGTGWRAWGDAAGLHLAVQFPQMRFDDAFFVKCRKHGIRIASVEQYSIRKGKHADKLLLGYGHLNEEEIREKIPLLRSVFLSR